MSPGFGASTIGWMNGHYERETWAWLHWNEGFIERSNIEVYKGHNSWWSKVPKEWAYKKEEIEREM